MTGNPKSPSDAGSVIGRLIGWLDGGVDVATQTIAQTMSKLYPLTTVPSRMAPAPTGDTTIKDPVVPKAAKVPTVVVDAHSQVTIECEMDPVIVHGQEQVEMIG